MKTIKNDTSDAHKITLAGYVTGYVSSIVLTLIAYYFVSRQIQPGQDTFSDQTITVLLGVLAIVQFFVQAIYFLHLKFERRPKWKLAIFGFMISVVLIIVIGSIWIMDNLNYNMMSPTETKVYMKTHEGF